MEIDARGQVYLSIHLKISKLMASNGQCLVEKQVVPIWICEWFMYNFWPLVRGGNQSLKSMLFIDRQNEDTAI